MTDTPIAATAESFLDEADTAIAALDAAEQKIIEARAALRRVKQNVRTPKDAVGHAADAIKATRAVVGTLSAADDAIAAMARCADLLPGGDQR